LTATKTTLYYTIYNESLELNPEKARKGGDRRLHYNIPMIKQIMELNPKKSKKGGKKA